jgi:hypothetical protein
VNARIDRVLVWFGAGSVLVELLGTFVGFAGGRSSLTISSSTRAVAKSIADPVSPVAWIGAYLELVSMGMFLAFAVWACARLGGGVLGAIGSSLATVYATLSIASLGVLDLVEYLQGHGLGVQAAFALTKINSALFVTTWFVSMFFLLAVAPLALAAGHRRLGVAAVAIAVVTLVAIPVSLDGLAQLLGFAWLGWLVAASLALRHPRRAPVPSPLAAATA